MFCVVSFVDRSDLFSHTFVADIGGIITLFGAFSVLY